jgi:hypothetical protein
LITRVSRTWDILSFISTFNILTSVLTSFSGFQTEIDKNLQPGSRAG